MWLIWFLMNLPGHTQVVWRSCLQGNRLPPISRWLMLQTFYRSSQLSFICPTTCCHITALLPALSDHILALKSPIRRSTSLLNTLPIRLCISLQKTGFPFFCNISIEEEAMDDGNLLMNGIQSCCDDPDWCWLPLHQGITHFAGNQDAHSYLMCIILIFLPWVEQHMSRR